MATTAMVARAVGAKDIRLAERTATQTLILGGAVSTTLAILGIILDRKLLGLLRPEPDVLELGVAYLDIMFIGMATMFFLFLVNAILRGAGDAVTPMRILIFSTILNIILDPLLIFGIWIFPRMGVRGAALATVLARGTGVLLGLRVLFKGDSIIRLAWREINLDFKIMWNMIKIAAPSSIDSNLRSISGVVLMGIVSTYGTFAVASLGIGMRIDMVVMMPGFGLAGATATLVGQNLGAQKPHRAERSAWMAAGFYIGIIIVIGTFLFAFADFIIRVFNSNPEVIRLGASFVRIRVFGYIFFALGLILARALMGAGDTLTPMVITGVSLFGILIPLASLLSRVGELKIMGVWLAMTIAMVIQGAITMGWFKLGRWKYKAVY
ncbi:MAG: MATE family efflux transporter [bacterium]